MGRNPGITDHKAGCVLEQVSDQKQRESRFPRDIVMQMVPRDQICVPFGQIRLQPTFSDFIFMPLDFSSCELWLCWRATFLQQKQLLSRQVYRISYKAQQVVPTYSPCLLQPNSLCYGLLMHERDMQIHNIRSTLL